MQCVRALVMFKSVRRQFQDENVDMNEFELLEAALKQPVHEVEPSIVRFMVYLHT